MKQVKYKIALAYMRAAELLEVLFFHKLQKKKKLHDFNCNPFHIGAVTRKPSVVCRIEYDNVQ
jgi:hypothetical protein